jgi:hypothetical protein
VIEGVRTAQQGMPDDPRRNCEPHEKAARTCGKNGKGGDYPSGDEDKLTKWRSDVENIRRDLKLLEFLSKRLPNTTTQKIGF